MPTLAEIVASLPAAVAAEQAKLAKAEAEAAALAATVQRQAAEIAALKAKPTPSNPTPAPTGYARTIQVGPGRDIKTIQQAESILQDDTAILLDPTPDGVFHDAPNGLSIRQKRVYIGGEGYPRIRYTGSSPSGNVISHYGDDLLIEKVTLDSLNPIRGGGNGVSCLGTNVTVRDIKAGPMKYVVHLRHRVDSDRNSPTVNRKPVWGSSGLIVEGCTIPELSDYFVYSDPGTSNLTIGGKDPSARNVIGSSQYEHCIRLNSDNVLIENNDLSNKKQAGWKTTITIREGNIVVIRKNISRIGMMAFGPLASDDGIKEYDYENKRVTGLIVEDNEILDCAQIKLELGLVDFIIRRNLIRSLVGAVFSVPGPDPRYPRPIASGLLEKNTATGERFIDGDTTAIQMAGNTLNGQPL